MPMRWSAPVAMLSTLFLVSVGFGQDEIDSGEQLIKDFLRGTSTISGRFEQQLVDANNNVIEESGGTLDIRRPGRFRWVYDDPYEQILVADGLNMWSYDVELEQVMVKAQSDALRSTPALLLGGSGDVLEEFNIDGAIEYRGVQWVQLRPKNTGGSFYKVELGFTDGQLSRMLFGDNLDQTTLIALVDVSFNEPIADVVFRFTPPDGVDVIGAPVAEPVSDL